MVHGTLLATSTYLCLESEMHSVVLSRSLHAPAAFSITPHADLGDDGFLESFEFVWLIMYH